MCVLLTEISAFICFVLLDYRPTSKEVILCTVTVVCENICAFGGWNLFAPSALKL